MNSKLPRHDIVLLGAGHTRRRALWLNALSASTGILGAIVVYSAAGWIPRALPFLLAFAAGNFLYIAMADLIPGLHHGSMAVGAPRQVALIAAGVATVIIL